MIKKIIIGLLIFIFIGILIWVYLFKSSYKNDIEMVKVSQSDMDNQVLLPDKIKKSVLDDQGIYIMDFRWEFSEVNLVDKIEIYQVKNNHVDVILANKFMDNLGFKGNLIEDNENVIAYTSNDGRTFYINKEDSMVHYYIDLMTKEVTPSGRRLELKILEENLMRLINRIYDWPNGLEIETFKMEKQVLMDSLYVPSGDVNSRIIYLEMIYKLNGFPLLSKKGTPIKVRFFDDGTMLDLLIDLPFKFNQSIGELPVKSLEEIKGLPISDFRILAVKGGEGTEVYAEDQEIIMDELIIRRGFVGYIYETKNEILQPYIMIEGMGIIEGKEVTILLGVPALKEDKYEAEGE